MKFKRLILVSTVIITLTAAVPYSISTRLPIAERNEINKDDNTEDKYIDQVQSLITASLFASPAENLKKAEDILLLFDDSAYKYFQLGRVEISLFDLKGFDTDREAAAGYFYKSYEEYKSKGLFYDAGVSLIGFYRAQAQAVNAPQYNDIVEAYQASDGYRDLSESLSGDEKDHLFVLLLDLYNYQEYSYTNSHNIYENLNKANMDVLSETEKHSFLITKAKLTVETLPNTSFDDYNPPYTNMKQERYKDAWDSVISALVYFKEKDTYEYYRGLDALTNLALRAPNLGNGERKEAIDRAASIARLKELCPNIHNLNENGFADYSLEDTLLTDVTDILEYTLENVFGYLGTFSDNSNDGEKRYPRLYYETLYLDFRVHYMYGWVNANNASAGSKDKAEHCLSKCVAIKQEFEDDRSNDCLNDSFLYEVINDRDLSGLEAKIASMPER